MKDLDEVEQSLIDLSGLLHIMRESMGDSDGGTLALDATCFRCTLQTLENVVLEIANDLNEAIPVEKPLSVA